MCRPYALAKFQHLPTLFTRKRAELSQSLDRLLKEELKRFGISPHAEGISDAKYAVVAAALEKQRAFRLATASVNERKLMEYERNTILWHTQRAIQSHEMGIINSIFDEASDAATVENAHDIGSEDENGLPDTSQEIGSDWRGTQSLNSNEQQNQYENSSRRSVTDFECGSDSSDARRKHIKQKKSSHSESNTKDILWKEDREDFLGRAVQVCRQLRPQQMKSQKFQASPETPKSSRFLPPQYKILSGTLSTVDDEDNIFDEADREVGLGDWESDGGESSPTQASARQVKEENMDATSEATSKSYM